MDDEPGRGQSYSPYPTTMRNKARSQGRGRATAHTLYDAQQGERPGQGQALPVPYYDLMAMAPCARAGAELQPVPYYDLMAQLAQQAERSRVRAVALPLPWVRCGCAPYARCGLAPALGTVRVRSLC
jgi:hypothetical protein